jgi:hypothetical protein
MENPFMGCEEIRDLLPLVAGGEAREDERRAVEEHVSHCTACSRELDLFREARANLALLREGEAPAGTWKSIWTGVRSDLFPGRRTSPLQIFDVVLRYAAVLMVGLAVGVGSYVATRPPRPLSRPEAPAAAELASGVEAGPGFIRNVRTAAPAPFHGTPRLVVPPAKAEGNAYLPRVEAIPASGERDY